jgi:hypothetical protein
MSLIGCFTRAKGSKYFPRYTRSCSKYHIVCSLSVCSFWPKWLLSANKVLPVKIAPQHTLHVSLLFTNLLARCDPCFYLCNFWFSYGARSYETVVCKMSKKNAAHPDKVNMLLLAMLTWGYGLRRLQRRVEGHNDDNDAGPTLPSPLIRHNNQCGKIDIADDGRC